MNKFINEVKHKMIENNISEKKLSDMIGYSELSINKWLNEEEAMPVMVSNSISKVLKLYELKQTDALKSLNNKFNKLSDENKIKVLEYIDHLQNNENKLNLSNKTN